MDVEHKKAVGKWDYLKVRHQDQCDFTADELEYIEPSAFSGTKTIYFADFPTFFSFEELIGPVFDPYFMNVESVVVRAELQYVSGTGRLYLDGSMEDYTWYV